ncbi:MAG TPA: (d)CMP kinase [Polyangiaceae bacterium]
MNRKLPVVAIDGPAGAGKSTVTQRVAASLGYVVLDTGALYRSVALAALRRGIDWSDGPRVAAVASELAARRAIEFRSLDAEEPKNAQQTVWLDHENVTVVIRSPEVSTGASRVSAVPEVRAALLELQRNVGREGGVVVEGRDIGSVVFPDAEAKFFLTASVEIRARRRLDELLARGERTDFESVARDVRERDDRDRTRAVAPLTQAPDAQLVDSSALSIDEVVQIIVQRVKLVELSLAQSS